MISRKFSRLVIFAAPTVTALAVLVMGPISLRDEAAARVGARRPTGYPQLVSVAPMLDGEMCQPVSSSAQQTLLARLQAERASAGSAATTTADARTSIDADRAPVRVIRDTHPTYSAVAVDPNYDEVYLQDENLFGIRVFNRLDNTPPTAAFTEPKRVISGIKTKLEFNCALYVDPQNGDIYSVNNDVVDTLSIFGRDAKGNVEPKRQLHTPHRSYGIAVDEERQELYLTIEFPAQVVVYRKSASGEEKPIRVLEGDRTLLEDPHGIAIDTKRKLMFVGNHGSNSTWNIPGSGKFHPPSITVYPLDASGNTPPLRLIQGPKAQLNWPAHLFVDTDREELFVANDVNDSVMVFRESDSGDVAPTRVIAGPRTGLKNPTGVYLDKKNGELWVSNMGNHSAAVFPIDANGDVKPLRVIRSSPLGQVALAIGNPGAVAYDSKREEILVPN